MGYTPKKSSNLIYPTPFKDHKPPHLKKPDFHGIVCLKQTLPEPTLTGIFSCFENWNNFLKCFKLFQ